MAQHIFIGSAAPTTTPTKVGQHFIDLTNKKSYISVGTASSADWELQGGASTVALNLSSHIADINNPHSTTKSQVGLSNVQNVDTTNPSNISQDTTHRFVSDAEKSTWNGKQDALGFTPENAANKGATNGYAPLVSGVVPAIYLPAAQDDVLEFANFAALPVTGSSGKIYTTLDNNKVYRWGGSAYVEISPSPGSTDSVTEGSVNLYFTNTRAINAVQSLLDNKVDKITPITPANYRDPIFSVNAQGQITAIRERVKGYVDSNTDVTTTIATNTVFVSDTIVVPSLADYYIEFVALYSHSSTNSSPLIDVLLDGVGLYSPDLASHEEVSDGNTASERILKSGFDIKSLTAGTHTIQLVFRCEAAGNQMTMRYGSIRHEEQ